METCLSAIKIFTIALALKVFLFALKLLINFGIKQYSAIELRFYSIALTQ